jgi:general secretion pathway protein G
MKRNGFTLVEILIVVVILGILAAIVVPQFTSASQEAVKGALASQIQTIESQIELYRVQNQGDYPDDDATDPLVGGGGNGGWGIMVSSQYLKGEPMNGYTGTSTVAVGLPVVVANGASPLADAVGWGYSDVTGGVVAAGYDNVNNLLSNENHADWEAIAF